MAQKKKIWEAVIHGMFLVLGLITVGCVLLITVYLVISGIPAIRKIGLGAFLTGKVWESTAAQPHYGILPFILTSVYGTAGAVVLGVPIGFLTAVYLSKVAPKGVKRALNSAVSLLAGIPSVVYGLIGLTVIVAWVRDAAAAMGQTITGFGIFSSAVVLAIMILPTITSLSIDALAAVPHEYREGSYALGCTRWQTIWNVVLKSAAPSLMTAVILGMTRAFGEALAVQMVVGNAIQMPSGLFTPASTLTSVLTMGMGNEAMGTVYNDVLWSLALLLLAMSLVFIMIIHLIGHKGAAKRG